MLRGKGVERSSIGWRLVLLAGVGGGLAEVLWVAFYTALAPISGIEVARQITASVFPGLASAAVAPLLGVGIHLLLSPLLAIAFAFIVWLPFARFYGMAGTMISALVVLVSIWAVNFFIVLPVLNPAFVTLMPYSVTLISKILFGLAMASVLSNSAISRDNIACAQYRLKKGEVVRQANPCMSETQGMTHQNRHTCMGLDLHQENSMNLVDGWETNMVGLREM